MRKYEGFKFILVLVLVFLVAGSGFAQIKPLKKMAVKKVAISGYTKTIASSVTIAGGAEYRYITAGGEPFDVSKYNYLNIIVGRKAKAIPDLEITVLFSVSVPAGALLIREYTNLGNDSKNELSVRLPSNYNKTGYILRVPVIAPMVYDIMVKNHGSNDLDDVHIILFAK
jgi:hypothetical protein